MLFCAIVTIVALGLFVYKGQKQMKGKKKTGIPLERTPEMQEIYDQVIPRLIAGESSVELERLFGVKAGTLRNWKKRALKKKQKYDKFNKMLQTAEENVTAENTKENQTEKAVAATEKKDPELPSQEEGTEISEVAVTALRSFFSNLLQRSISGLEEVLIAGESIKTATFQGAITHCTVPLTVSERVQIASAIKALRQEFASLHSLPLEPLKIKNLEVQTKQLAAAQHLHLHSHGSKAIQPAALPGQAHPAAEIIDVEPEPVQHSTNVGTEDLEDWQKELIDS